MSKMPPKKVVKKKSVYSFRLDDELIKKVDMLAKKAGYNRNEYVAWILGEAVK